jgi:hypothetical protein
VRRMVSFMVVVFECGKWVVFVRLVYWLGAELGRR